MQFPGIYKIVNKTTQKYYVGSSRIPMRRWKQHKYTLLKQKHANDYLQRAWNKYGESNFDFIIIKELDKNISDADLLNEEQYWLNISKTDPLSYNLTFVANNPNMLLSDYSKKKRSESLKKVIRTDEWKKKISDSHIGICPNKQSRIKMSLAKKGKQQTLEHIKNATNSRKKNWLFTSPNGEIVNIYDLKSFCKKYNLHSGNMYWVHSGKKQQYKGWKRIVKETI